MERDLKHEIAKHYGIGLTIDQTAFICEVPVEEISSLVMSDYLLRKSMAEKRNEFIENQRLYKERRSRNRSTPQQRAKQNEYKKERIAKNPQLKVRNSISVSIRGKLKGNKTNFTFPSLGYTIADLINHLESLFLEGMSWENYGTRWHIDHKTPDSWFTYTSMECEGFKKSWALSNLQPLWKEENLSKSNRFASI